MRHGQAAFLATVTLALGVTACGGGSSGSSADLVFTSHRDRYYTLYTMKLDGSDQKPLKESGPADTHEFFTGLHYADEADWSPDGKTIVYASSRRTTGKNSDILLIDANGSDRQYLTSTDEDDRQPSWSPDGASIAFSRANDLWVMKADGSDPHSVVTGPGLEVEPAWSPDGDWVAFVRADDKERLSEIWLVRPDGSGLRQLTHLGTESRWPSWAPDSSKLIFGGRVESGGYELFTVGVDGGGQRQLTTTDVSTVHPYGSVHPSWSSDGKLIAFSRFDTIWTRDEQGHETQLTRNPDDFNPDWKPAD